LTNALSVVDGRNGGTEMQGADKNEREAVSECIGSSVKATKDREAQKRERNGQGSENRNRTGRGWVDC
jgi:hypothetical protein